VLVSIALLPKNNTLLQRIEDLSRQVAALRAEQAGFHFLKILMQKFIEINKINCRPYKLILDDMEKS
jgi:hypothetical protein